MKTLLIMLVVFLFGVLLLSLFLRKYPATFYRDKPIGLCEAQLEDKPNWVSSLVELSSNHYVAPLPISSLNKIAFLIEQQDPKAYIVIHPFYIEGYRRTRYFGFTDWFCISELGHITSTATLGYSDLGLNKRWAEKLNFLLSN